MVAKKEEERRTVVLRRCIKTVHTNVVSNRIVISHARIQCSLSYTHALLHTSPPSLSLSHTHNHTQTYTDIQHTHIQTRTHACLSLNILQTTHIHKNSHTFFSLFYTHTQPSLSFSFSSMVM